MAEAAPVVCMPSGFEEEFVKPVEEDFQCLICSLPLREPVLTRCGHRFCRQCLDEHLRRQQVANQPLTCPVDRIEMMHERDIFPDKATERKILSFVIKCPSEGCEWTGELREKQTHLKSCPFESIFCTNESCQEKLARKDLEKHVITTCQWTIVQCYHCDEPHPKCQLQEHFLNCKRYPVDCPNSCGTVIPREEISAHTDTECPLTIISCPYDRMGCDTKEHFLTCKRYPVDCPNSCGTVVPREEISAHIDTECPLTMIYCPYDRMGCDTKMERIQMKSHVQSATSHHLDLACKKLDNTQEELKQTRSEMEEKVNMIQTELERKMNLMLNQLEEKLKVSSLEQRVARIEKDSTFLWKIDGFSKLLRQEKSGEREVTSDPFYTRPYGYKLTLCIFPNGVQPRNDGYLTVFIVIMKGEYDAALPWPFPRHKVTFTLIDQQDNPQERKNIEVTETIDPDSTLFNTKRPKSECDSCVLYGQINFVSHDQLKTRRYIVDGVTFLQVQVDPLS